jgi:hypothetical protein
LSITSISEEIEPLDVNLQPIVEGDLRMPVCSSLTILLELMVASPRSQQWQNAYVIKLDQISLELINQWMKWQQNLKDGRAKTAERSELQTPGTRGA